MVKEFDELQGVMGAHYTLKQGEDPQVSQAIFEHYLPRTTDDQLPQTTIGTILSLADKLDTVISFISIGEIPKASADPFAIRRNAIGVVKILIKKGIDLDIRDITQNKDVIEFIASRVESFLQSEGFETDIIKAVMSVDNSNPYSVYKKVEALSEIKSLPDYENIIMVFKRVANIVPQNFVSEVDPSLFEKQQELDLYNQTMIIKQEFESAIDKKDYHLAINLLLKLKPFIDNFFDNVMVMVDDQKIKNNRLSLLNQINSMFRKIADFTKIIGG